MLKKKQVYMKLLKIQEVTLNEKKEQHSELQQIVSALKVKHFIYACSVVTVHRFIIASMCPH